MRCGRDANWPLGAPPLKSIASTRASHSLYTQGVVTSLNLWSQYDLYAVGQHGVLWKLSGEDLSRSSNKN